jgi:hypothetical protein
LVASKFVKKAEPKAELCGLTCFVRMFQEDEDVWNIFQKAQTHTQKPNERKKKLFKLLNA